MTLRQEITSLSDKLLGFSISAKGEAHSCNCVGPKNGEPYCPCRMRGVFVRDGRWIQPERDLGPVRQQENVGFLGGLNLGPNPLPPPPSKET